MRTVCAFPRGGPLREDRPVVRGERGWLQPQHCVVETEERERRERRLINPLKTWTILVVLEGGGQTLTCVCCQTTCIQRPSLDPRGRREDLKRGRRLNIIVPLWLVVEWHGKTSCSLYMERRRDIPFLPLLVMRGRERRKGLVWWRRRPQTSRLGGAGCL